MATNKQVAEFRTLTKRASEYLTGLSQVTKRGEKGEIGQVVVDEMGISQLFIDIGLAAPKLDTAQQATLRLMVQQINCSITILETVRFRRRHC